MKTSNFQKKNVSQKPLKNKVAPELNDHNMKPRDRLYRHNTAWLKPEAPTFYSLAWTGAKHEVFIYVEIEPDTDHSGLVSSQFINFF